MILKGVDYKQLRRDKQYTNKTGKFHINLIIYIFYFFAFPLGLNDQRYIRIESSLPTSEIPEKIRHITKAATSISRHILFQLIPFSTLKLPSSNKAIILKYKRLQGEYANLGILIQSKRYRDDKHLVIKYGLASFYSCCWCLLILRLARYHHGY